MILRVINFTYIFQTGGVLMKKLILVFGFILFSFSVQANDLVWDIDGTWKGSMVFKDVPTSYELEVVAKTVDRKLMLSAKTEYADLDVVSAKLSFSDVHSPVSFDADMYEFVTMPSGDYFFRFELHGDVFSKELIEGDVEYTSSWSPYLHTASGSFTLKKVK
jgi:hypothetical protein